MSFEQIIVYDIVMITFVSMKSNERGFVANVQICLQDLNCSFVAILFVSNHAIGVSVRAHYNR